MGKAVAVTMSKGGALTCSVIAVIIALAAEALLAVAFLPGLLSNKLGMPITVTLAAQLIVVGAVLLLVLSRVNSMSRIS